VGFGCRRDIMSDCRVADDLPQPTTASSIMWRLITPTVQSEVRKRGISLLLHSTHVFRNLPLILQEGRIETAQGLINRYGHERAARLLHDPLRYEKFTVGLDYLNCSLSVPNCELLYHRSKSAWQSEWVHLALDVSLIYRIVTLFAPLNAAVEHGRSIGSGLSAFQSLFADHVEGYSRKGVSANCPTHPQAEVLIKGALPLEFVQKILVPSENVAHGVRDLLDMNELRIPVECAPQLFVWPERLMKK
jgi:hypothetical protein